MRATKKAKRKNSTVQEIDTDLFSLLKTPFENPKQLSKLKKAERPLFLLVNELYRIVELALRRQGFMMEIFSKYRVRDHFDEYLGTRFHELDLNDLKGYDPQISTLLIAAYNILHELKLDCKYTNELPQSLEQYLEAQLSKLTRTWNELALLLEKKYKWKTKKL